MFYYDIFPIWSISHIFAYFLHCGFSNANRIHKVPIVFVQSKAYYLTSLNSCFTTQHEPWSSISHHSDFRTPLSEVYSTTLIHVKNLQPPWNEKGVKAWKAMCLVMPLDRTHKVQHWLLHSHQCMLVIYLNSHMKCLQVRFSDYFFR